MKLKLYDKNRRIVPFMLLLVSVFVHLAETSLAEAAEAEQWHPFDMGFKSTQTYENPFLDVEVSATFSGPGGQTLTIPGFRASDGNWIVRFAPLAPGTWTYRSSSSDPQLNGKTGTLNCTPNAHLGVHGRLGVDPKNPHHYRFEDSTPYLQVGFEVDWLALLDFGDPNITKAKVLIDMYASHGFTEVIFTGFSYDTSWKQGKTVPDDFGPPTSIPWMGSPSAPDHTRMNPEFFAQFDRVMDYLLQKGITAHILLLVKNKKVVWPPKLSPAEDLYFRYFTARYQAYPNLIWDLCKESYGEPNHAYLANRLALIKKSDAYHRLLGIHDDYHPGKEFGNDDINADPKYNANLDLYIDQEHADFYNSILRFRSRFNQPILNAEHTYEIGNDGGHTYHSVQSKEECLKRTCEILMAGGYTTYYYTYHAWDIVRYTEVPEGLKYQGYLNRFFKCTQWYELVPADTLIGGTKTTGKPDDSHCLANPGREYIVYMSGAVIVTLQIDKANTPLAGQWHNLYTGEVKPTGDFNNGSQALSNPWAVPAMLHLTAKVPASHQK